MVIKQAVKTIITVFVGIFCSLVCIAAIGIYGSETNYLKYDLENAVEPEITDVEATWLGENYMGSRSEDYTYYQLAVSLSNKSNYGRADNSLYFWYESAEADTYYSVSKATTEGSNYYNGDYYIPAGKDGVIYEIIRVEKGCKRVRIILNNYFTEEKTSYLVEL